MNSNKKEREKKKKEERKSIHLCWSLAGFIGMQGNNFFRVLSGVPAICGATQCTYVAKNKFLTLH